MKMRALKRFTFAGRNIAAGGEFDAPQKDVRVLSAVHLAVVVPVERSMAVVRKVLSAKKVELVVVEPVVVEPVVEPTPDPEPGRDMFVGDEPKSDVKPKRAYTRRDMTAEGSSDQ